MPVKKLHLDRCKADELQRDGENTAPDFTGTCNKPPNRDPIYSLLREAIISSVSSIYSKLDMEARALCNADKATTSVEELHTQIVNTIVKGHCTPPSNSIQLEDLYRVATTTKELWEKSCGVSDFLTSAMVTYIKLCIYRFGDSGVFSDALNTINI